MYVVTIPLNRQFSFSFIGGDFSCARDLCNPTESGLSVLAFPASRRFLVGRRPSPRRWESPLVCCARGAGPWLRRPHSELRSLGADSCLLCEVWI